MTPLASAAPTLMSEVRSALASAGYESAASQVESGEIERCTYDDDAEAGYVYFVSPKPSAHFANLSAPIAKTLPFLEVGFNVDLDHDGNVFGVEFLDRSDFVSELRDASVL
ncbi:DUF2283 domain-containing protein [Methylomonas sp. ZR1]|uniref:DUF2283 domain-containing protein n=1 Tax=unclassified Methylomonas TaxID=2608980 RepID=UPI001492E5C2|nr:DUF2283 domain-containing protein [Methylomonas sp. ZR1]NOV31486.1 DUF2283 domain-containing protein [Methylomonas sp. ZR1]